jgi:hypothetical protein
MTRSSLAVAADYADAMLVARRWKNLLFLLLMLFLLIQIGVFLGVRFYNGSVVTLLPPTPNHPAPAGARDMTSAIEWLINFTGFLSIICVVVLCAVLLLIVGIMLVGRLIGISHVISAFVWCVVLAALLFPWQSLWNYPLADTAQTAPTPSENIEVGPRYGWPGALYTWPELVHRAHFATERGTAAINGWARFVGWPVFALIVLFSVQIRSSRGLKYALGETDVKAVVPGMASGAGRV